ncbi:MAG: YdcF family protein [Pseudomonadota bacterium]
MAGDEDGKTESAARAADAATRSAAKRRRPLILRALRALLLLAVVGFIAVFALVRGSAYYFTSQAPDAIAADSADVIIVLSAGLGRDGVGLDPFTQARLERGIGLWRDGAAPLLLMSGGVDLTTGLHLSENMKLAAMELGVSRRAILVEGRSISTFENARFTLDVAQQEGWRRAIIVTDDFHMLRAWTLFEFWRGEADLEIIALAAARGRRDVGFARGAMVLLRETLAYPFNVVKIIGQLGLEALGRGEERTIR